MNAARLHATVDGPAAGPVLVLGSSLGTTGAMWQPQVARLAERFRVVRYDHRGHGGSEVRDEPCTVADLARDVLGLLDRLGVGRAHHAGLSLGGMVGMWLAAHAPERVDRLAVLCTSARLGPAHGWLDRASAVRAGGPAAVADAVVQRWFTPAFATARPEVVARHRAMLVGTDREGYARCCEAIATMDLVADLRRVTAPTLVVAGAEDLATPVEHAALIAATVPGSRLVVVEPGAHLVSVERADEVTGLLLEHFGPPRDPTA